MLGESHCILIISITAKVIIYSLIITGWIVIKLILEKKG